MVILRLLERIADANKEVFQLQGNRRLTPSSLNLYCQNFRRSVQAVDFNYDDWERTE
ncbi:MAG: hypothetical protein GX922_04775 [Firmicutes bacterium]|jgi:hypothetical protein|nr:hypothetical protein [Bacillota bacterium]